MGEALACYASVSDPGELARLFRVALGKYSKVSGGCDRQSVMLISPTCLLFIVDQADQGGTGQDLKVRGAGVHQCMSTSNKCGVCYVVLSVSAVFYFQCLLCCTFIALVTPML